MRRSIRNPAAANSSVSCSERRLHAVISQPRLPVSGHRTQLEVRTAETNPVRCRVVGADDEGPVVAEHAVRFGRENRSGSTRSGTPTRTGRHRPLRARPTRTDRRGSERAAGRGGRRASWRGRSSLAPHRTRTPRRPGPAVPRCRGPGRTQRRERTCPRDHPSSRERCWPVVESVDGATAACSSYCAAKESYWAGSGGRTGTASHSHAAILDSLIAGADWTGTAENLVAHVSRPALRGVLELIPYLTGEGGQGIGVENLLLISERATQWTSSNTRPRQRRRARTPG